MVLSYFVQREKRCMEAKNTKSSEVVGVLRQDSLRSNFVFFVLQVYRYLLFSPCLRPFLVQPKAFYRYCIQAKHNIERYIGWVRKRAFCCCSFLHAQAPVISRTAKVVCCKQNSFLPESLELLSQSHLQTFDMQTPWHVDVFVWKTWPLFYKK